MVSAQALLGVTRCWTLCMLMPANQLVWDLHSCALLVGTHLRESATARPATHPAHPLHHPLVCSSPSQNCLDPLVCRCPSDAPNCLTATTSSGAAGQCVVSCLH